MRVTIVTFGTRGNFQSGLAIGKRLRNAGHDVQLISSENFRQLAQRHQFDLRALPFDIRAIIGEAVRKKGSMLAAGGQMMKALADFEVFEGVWAECPKDSDVIIGHVPNSLAHVLSIGEKLDVPVVAYTADPKAPTGEFPFPALPLPFYSGRWRALNRLTYRLVAGIDWRRSQASFNRLRTEFLGLPEQTQAEYTAAVAQTPILHGFSQHLVPRPADWADHYHITGFLFADTDEAWQPPDGLVEFLQQEPMPICITFSSMGSADAQQQADLIIEAVRKSQQRAVVLGGWGGVADTTSDDSLLFLDAAPHDWLFPQVAAVVHHASSGTSAATLRAGLPSVCVPHTFDQPFWAGRLAQQHVAAEPIPHRRLTADLLAQAIGTVVTDQKIRASATSLGATIRAEDGVGRSVEIVEQLV